VVQVIQGDRFKKSWMTWFFLIYARSKNKWESSLCLTLDDKKEELNIDFVLSKENLEA